MTWTTIAVLAVGTYLLKAVGPVVAGDRHMPPGVERVLMLLPPALFGALIAVQAFAGETGGLTLDARAGGLLAAGVAVWFRAPFLVVVMSGVLATALLRLQPWLPLG